MFNATEAAKIAKYSKKTARSTGAENMTKPAIQEEIGKLLSKSSEKFKLDAEEFLKRMNHVYEVSTQQRMIKVRNKITGRWEHGDYVLDLANANRANEHLGKYLKLLTDKVLLGGDKDNPLEANQVIFYVSENNRKINEE